MQDSVSAFLAIDSIFSRKQIEVSSDRDNIQDLIISVAEKKEAELQNIIANKVFCLKIDAAIRHHRKYLAINNLVTQTCNILDYFGIHECNVLAVQKFSSLIQNFAILSNQTKL